MAVYQTSHTLLKEERKSAAAETMNNMNEEDVQVRQQPHHLVIYRHSPKPILVEAGSFQTLVQSLTSVKRKRKRLTFNEDVEKVEALEDSSSQRDVRVQSIQTLVDYLDRLDKECPPPSRASGNRGFFATAGLVKGVNLEDGLQQIDNNPDSTIEDEPQEATSRDCLAKVLPSLSSLPKSVCAEWTGCLSPRSNQVMKSAKKIARWATSRELPDSGPWKISMEKIADIDYDCSEDDGGITDLVFYTGGEITFVGKS